MSNWLFFCAGFTQVASVILQAQVDFRCETELDVEFNLNYTSGLHFTPQLDENDSRCNCMCQYSIDWRTCNASSSNVEYDLSLYEECLAEFLATTPGSLNPSSSSSSSWNIF